MAILFARLPVGVGLPPTPLEYLERFAKHPRSGDVKPATARGNLSLADRMTPARDQGSLGTCASFATISCLEYFVQLDLSEACLTHESEKDYGDCVAGADLGRTFTMCHDEGVVRDAEWRYDGVQVCWTNPPDVSGSTRYKFDDIWLVWAPNNDGTRGDPIPLIKAVLENLRVPVAVGLPVFKKADDQLDAGWEMGPDIRMPTPINRDLLVREQHYHAIAICGYDDDKSRFDFKNSWWGPGWGRRGFGTIPYEYIRAFATEAYAGTL